MDPTRTAQPGVEPVTLAQAKLHLRVDDAADDDLITSLIVAARMDCEARLQRTLITTPWQLVCDAFPAGGAVIALPMAPVISVTSVEYTDPQGQAQTMSGANWRLSTAGDMGRLQPTGGSWPETLAAIGAVRIAYSAGYGPVAAGVPAPLRQWVLLAIGDMYANRLRSAERPSVPHGFADALLDPYKVWSL